MFIRYGLLAASIATIVACSGADDPPAAPAVTEAEAPIAPAPAPTPTPAPAETVQSAPIAPVVAPVIAVDAGAAEDASPPPAACLTCSAKLGDPSAAGELCAPGSKALYQTWIECACKPCSESCGMDVCAGNPTTPSQKCSACLGYASQVCFEESQACKGDDGKKK